jgi:hypothetical protein
MNSIHHIWNLRTFTFKVYSRQVKKKTNYFPYTGIDLNSLRCVCIMNAWKIKMGGNKLVVHNNHSTCYHSQCTGLHILLHCRKLQILPTSSLSLAQHFLSVYFCGQHIDKRFSVILYFDFKHVEGSILFIILWNSWSEAIFHY